MTDNAEKAGAEERKQFILEWVKAHPLETSGAGLYAALVEKYPDITAGGHRGMVGRLFPDGRPWERAHTCPNVEKGTCTTVARNVAEGLELFGHRMKKTQFQSYCKKCRNAHRREMRAKRKADREARDASASAAQEKEAS